MRTDCLNFLELRVLGFIGILACGPGGPARVIRRFPVEEEIPIAEVDGEVHAGLQFTRQQGPAERVLQAVLQEPVDGPRAELRVVTELGDGARRLRRDLRRDTALLQPLL